MSHLRPISKPKCPCGKRASVRLFNRYNSELGAYCSSCGKRELRDAERREKEYDDSLVVYSVMKS